MTSNNIDGFFSAVQADEALRQELAASTSEQAFYLTAVRRGSERGFSFTVDDVRAAQTMKPAGELNEAALASVAGGMMQTVSSWRFCTWTWLGC